MSNIRRVTKSTNCVDCYNNNPFQQNEGLKSYAKMISNPTNTESCKSCEPCYDPYLKKVFTEGCLTGEGTECNPLSIDLDCIPSGGVSSCTVITPDCCTYSTPVDICFKEEVVINFGTTSIVFGSSTTTETGESYFVISFGNVEEGNSVFVPATLIEENVWTITFENVKDAIDAFISDKISIIYTEEGVITVQRLTCEDKPIIAIYLIDADISFTENLSVTRPITVTKDVSTFYTNEPISSEGQVYGVNSEQLNYDFQIRINDNWNSYVEDVVNGFFSINACFVQIPELEQWRVIDLEYSEIISEGTFIKECSGGEEITKSICEWIDYLYNQSSSGSENIYTSDGEATDALRTAIFQGLKFETSSEDEYGFHIESNTVNRSGFRVDAESQEDYGIYLKGISQITDGINISGESYGIESGVEILGYTTGGVGILLNGYSSANNNGINLQAYSEEQDALYLSGQTNNIALADIVISPFNGKLQFDNIQEVTGASYYYVEDSEGYTRKIEYASSSGENLYNSNGTLLNDRTLEGDDKTLFFQNLRSFGVEAQPQDNDTYGIALGNNQGGSPLSLAGIILGGVGKNQGIVLTGLTTGDDGAGTSAIQITGENSNALANDISINPQNGRLKISNLPTDNSASQVASKDSNDRLVWRDVSSIASSLPSNVCKMIGIDFTKISTTTNAADQVIGHVLIPANTFGTGSSLIEVESCISRLVGGASPAHRLCINTSISFSGATTIAIISLTTTNKYSKGERTFECGTNFIRGFNFATNSAIDDSGSSNAPNQSTINWGVDQYILTVITNTTGETTQHEFTSVELKKV